MLTNYLEMGFCTDLLDNYIHLRNTVTISNHGFVDYLLNAIKTPSILCKSALTANLLEAIKYYKFRNIQNNHLSFDRSVCDKLGNELALRTECLACDKVLRLMGDGSMPFGRKDITKHTERALWDSVIVFNLRHSLAMLQ